MSPLPMVFKNFKLLLLFVVGIITVFSLILTRNYFKINTAHGDTNQNLIVFAGQLSPQFSNWSWSSSVNFSTVISFTPSAWGGLYLHGNTAIDMSQYTSLQFAMQTSDPAKNFTLIFYGSNNQQLKTLSLAPYAGGSQNGWVVYTIPASDLPSSFNGFALQETSGNAGPVTYLESIQFVAKQAIQTSTQTYQIYSDSLAAGWINWSWNVKTNFTETANPYQGSNFLSFTPTSGYAGLYLHTDQGIDTSAYQAITFAVKASQPGQALGVGIYDTNNQLLHSVLPLDTYGGQPVQDMWKVYTIPLSDLNASNKLIKGFMLQEIHGQSQQTFYVDQIELIGSSSQTTQTQSSNNSNPLSGMQFFNDPSANPALQQEQQWQASDPTNAALMAKIASQPKAIWIGNWTSNVQSYIQNVVGQAKAANTVPVFVAYNIPQRDCGGYSSGGTNSANAYQSWIDAFASGIGNERAVIILEPDALSQISCLSQTDQQTRLSLLSYAVTKFKSLGQTAVYIDAGHAGWIAPTTMANTLKNAGISQADGFSLNVSNFATNSDSISYGQQISAMVGGKHFVIDTSRNGTGPAANNEWCNPAGRALGSKPTTQTGNALVDAFLWIKYPGESDGTCNGGPAAGVWYPSYALGLAQRANW